MNKPYQTAIVWFRRSIRLDDNHALLQAAQEAVQVVPVFVLDPTILDHPTTGKARTRFLFESLAALDADLRERGSRLHIRHGKPVDQLLRLVHETNATALYFGRDYEPYSTDRDTAVADAMKANGVTVVQTNDHLLTEPESILTKTDTPYTVFTPYKRVWLTQAIDAPEDAPAHIHTPTDIDSEPLPQMDAPGQTVRVKGGDAEGERWLGAFLDTCVADYNTARDFPANEGTSRLSAYLRMGVVSPRRVYAKLRERRAALEVGRRMGPDTWLSELAWRDFYYQILANFPHVAGGAFRRELNDIEWENRDDYFAAWCDGRTGYPIVDAAQRQMNHEGWMHNRARMVTASFLTKDLLINWQEGERYFMQKLVDGDLASNNGGWQWAAGTGTDAQPFFRIFNPTSQGERFDPDGAYVKRWVPELAKVPPKFVHSPWLMPPVLQEAVGCVLGRDYPPPIVDHKIQRERALTLYRREAAEALTTGKAQNAQEAMQE